MKPAVWSLLFAALLSGAAAEVCDPAYPVCFDVDADKAIPDPVQLKDLAQFTPALLNPATRLGGVLHWPGSVLKVDDSGLINYRAGVGRARVVVRGPGNTGVSTVSFPLQAACGRLNKYEWRPDKAAWACTTLSQDVYVETRPLDEATFLSHLVVRCPRPPCATGVQTSNADEWSLFGGYAGWRTTLNDNTTYALTYYTLFRDAPAPTTLGRGVLADSAETWAVVVLAEALDRVPAIFADPAAAFADATSRHTAIYQAIAPPSRCTTAWCRERYYRALTNLHYNWYKATPQVASRWADYWAMSPGSGYNGVWVWDSFFAAWAGTAVCRDEACVDQYMDSLRILSVNQAADGRLPRQVTYNDGHSGWQAPGGWSFAVDQADQKFGTTRWSTEFYDTLKRFHTYIRTRDSDGDNRFEWGGTNSGWDGSVRWQSSTMEALDLNAWMILDAEALREMAARLGFTEDAAQFEAWRQAYIQAYQDFCDDGPWCHDSFRDGRPGNVTSNAAYFGLLAGALTPDKAAELAAAVFDPATFGPYDATGQAVLPTVSRDNWAYDPCGKAKAWSGQTWLNTNLVAYLGLLRYNQTDAAEAVRTGTLATLERSAVGWESLCSANYTSPTGQTKTVGDTGYVFAGGTYVWSDAAMLIMASAGPLPPGESCSDGIQNQDETGPDCGGVCGGHWYDNACHPDPPPARRYAVTATWTTSVEAESPATATATAQTQLTCSAPLTWTAEEDAGG